MAKITRYSGNLQAFASAAPGTERTVFGATTQANDLTSQINADFLRGWGIVGPSDQPALEDFNGAMYTHGQLLAYLHQAGIPEYDASQEYFIGSITQLGGDTYLSLIALNIGNNPASSPAAWRPIGSTVVVGDAKNVRAYVSAASASMTITADELVLKTALGGRARVFSAFSQTLNTGTVGAGGMDTGLAPASGDLAIYAIHNPTTGAVALLGQVAASSNVTEVYSGANMPAGFTHSALVAAWRTNASRQMIIGRLYNRRVAIQNATMINITGPGTTTRTAFFTGNAVPLCAKEIDVNVSAAQTVSGSGVQLFITSDTIEIDLVTSPAAVAGTSSTSINATRGRCLVNVPGNLIYYMASTTNGQFSCAAAGYTF